MRRRVVHFVLLTALAVGLMAVGTASAVVGEGPFQHFPIAVAPDGQNQPSVSYPWVVYKDTNDCDPVIRAYNLETRVTTLAIGSLTTSGSPEHANPDIDGTKVVYSSDAATDCDIYLYDLSTKRESIVCQAEGGQGNPSIDYPYVAWTDQRNSGVSSYDVYMKNLATGIESKVTTASGSEREPTVWDHYVCYSDRGNDAYLYDIYTGKSSNITSDVPNLSQVYDPYLADGVMAWYGWDSAKSAYVIQMYDIATRQYRDVAASSNLWHPEVGGGWITWVDASSGINQVYGYHIQSRTVRRLVSSTVDSEGDTTKGGRCTVAGTNLNGKAVAVWHDHRNEFLPGTTTLNPDGVSQADLYAQYLTDMFGPVIDVTGVEDGALYYEGVKPVVTCAEGRAVSVTLNGVATSLGSTITAEGRYSLVATARDSVGNPGRVEVDFIIDNDEAPAGTMALCGGTSVVGTRTITIDSYMTDAMDMEMRYSIDGEDFTSWESFAAQVPVVVDDEGFQEVIVEYRDENYNTCSRWDWVYVVTNPKPLTLGTPRSASRVRHGSLFTVTGALAPSHVGPGTVRVYKYRYLSGRWTSYGYTTVNVTSTGNGYSGKVKLPYAGKWRLRAYHKDTGHSASRSQYMKSVTAY